MEKLRRKRRLNRKAAALVPFLALILFVGGVALIVYYSLGGKEIAMDFGKPQRKILETFADGEAARKYIQLSAKYATHQALYGISGSGGYESVDCPPDVLPVCTVKYGGYEVNSFSCPQRIEDGSTCANYTVDNCAEFPCKQTLNAEINCELNTETDEVGCSLSSKRGKLLEEYTCENVNAGECKSLGGELEKTKDLTLDVDCEAKEFERECNISDCKSIGSYAYWYNKGKKCVPSGADIKPIFTMLFEDNFYEYLGDYKLKGMERLGIRSLADTQEFNLTVDLDGEKITGYPAKVMSVVDITDEEGNIKGTEEVEAESSMFLHEEVEYGTDLQPALEYTYLVNPYFEYEIPYSPADIINDVKSKASNALSGIGSCSGDIASKASSQQESLAGDAVFDWKITGEQKDGACVVKFDVAPKNYKIYGASSAGKVSKLETGAPVRFAVKYSGNAPNL